MGRLRGGQVFGNGTRFVWYFLGLQELQVAEAALVDAVEANFITVQQGEGRGIGETAEGGGEAAGRVAGGLGVDALAQQAGFDGPGAAHAPGCGDRFLDDAELDAIGRLEALQVLSEDGLETFARFAFHDNAAAEQVMAARVLRRDLFRSEERRVGKESRSRRSP